MAENKELTNKLSSMNNAALKARKTELEFKYNADKKRIDEVLTEMEGLRDEYKAIDRELNKRHAL